MRGLLAHLTTTNRFLRPPPQRTYLLAITFLLLFASGIVLGARFGIPPLIQGERSVTKILSFLRGVVLPIGLAMGLAKLFTPNISQDPPERQRKGNDRGGDVNKTEIGEVHFSIFSGITRREIKPPDED